MFDAHINDWQVHVISIAIVNLWIWTHYDVTRDLHSIIYLFIRKYYSDYDCFQYGGHIRFSGVF